MKPFVILLFLTFSFISYSQVPTNSNPLENIKTYHLELTTLLENYEMLTDEQKISFSSTCDEAAPYYQYVSVKATVPKDSLEKYDISKICKEYQGLEAIGKLKTAQESLAETQEEFEKMLDSLKRVSDSDHFKAVTLKLNELKDSINSQCETANSQLASVKNMESVNEADINALDFGSCDEFTKTKEDEIKTKNFIIVGDGDPINSDNLFEKQTAQNFYYEVIGSESTTQLGTFEIPADLSRIKLYVDADLDDKCQLQKNSKTFIEVPSFRRLFTKWRKESDNKRHYNGEQNQKSKDDTGSNDCSLNHNGLSKSLDSYLKLSGIDNNSDVGSLTNEIPEAVLFRSIAFEMRDGGLVDIRLEVFDVDKKVKMYFESRAPISLLNFTRASSKAFLHFSNKFSASNEKRNWDQNVLKYLRLRVSDVLKYSPYPGNNYVPDDVTLTLPKDLENESSENATRAYKLINDSSLKNILDLRTYTDFLGLFGDESNGLFQIEGRADFYLNPFNFNRSSLYIFKKITPYIRYSRLEEGNDFIATTTLENDIQISFEGESLELIEKSNLEFGFDLNLAHFRFFKESPVWVSFHAPVNLYNTRIRPIDMANVDENNIEEQEEMTVNTDDDFNFNVVGYGLGMNWEVKRLKNLGLNLGTSFKWYSFLGDYSQFNLEEPDDLKTYSLDAEIFYYPGEDESQSIFLRMRSFRDISSGEAAFQQIQFGYRFTLGAGKVEAKN